MWLLRFNQTTKANFTNAGRNQYHVPPARVLWEGQTHHFRAVSVQNLQPASNWGEANRPNLRDIPQKTGLYFLMMSTSLKNWSKLNETK